MYRINPKKKNLMSFVPIACSTFGIKNLQEFVKYCLEAFEIFFANKSAKCLSKMQINDLIWARLGQIMLNICLGKSRYDPIWLLSVTIVQFEGKFH